jgi:hypothetical protein
MPADFLLKERRMKKLCTLFVFLMLLSLQASGQSGIPLTTAGEAFKLRSATPGFLYTNPPPLVIEGWEKARLGTIAYSGSVKTDIYWPSEPSATPLPVILVVFSYTSSQFIQENGKSFREIEPMTIWFAQLANKGFVVVCPDIENVGKDMGSIMTWINKRGPSLGIDSARMGFLSFSANPKTIPYLLSLPEAASLKAIALYYPELVPASWEVPSNVALHIIKAGKDAATRNVRIDLLAKKFKEAGNYVEVITYGNGIHAFDLKDQSPEAASIMMTTLEFFSRHL